MNKIVVMFTIVQVKLSYIISRLFDKKRNKKYEAPKPTKDGLRTLVVLNGGDNFDIAIKKNPDLFMKILNDDIKKLNAINEI